MDRVFRSRGIRLLYDNGKTIYNEKIYYEPDDSCFHNNKYIDSLQSQDLIRLFEYSMKNDVIDTYNYHVNLTKDNLDGIYKGLTRSTNDIFCAIRSCFGNYMRNYTIGYRLQNDCIEQQSYYFYPTIWKADRYGIKGITEPDVFKKGIINFVDRVTGDVLLEEPGFLEFVNMIIKFKGISIHLMDDRNGYKIYGRVNHNLLKEYLNYYYKFDVKKVDEYGECVLAALRITENQIKGINIYFLR